MNSCAKTQKVKRFFSSDEAYSEAQGAQEGHWRKHPDANFNEDYGQSSDYCSITHDRP